MGWIAAKQIKILRDGKYVDLRPGDACPEAENWPNLKAWERTKYVQFVEEEAENTPSEDRKFSVAELRKFTKKQMIEVAGKHGLSVADELKRNAIIELIQDAQGI